MLLHFRTLLSHPFIIQGVIIAVVCKNFADKGWKMYKVKRNVTNLYMTPLTKDAIFS